MFGKMGNMMKQMQLMQKLMKDENFKAFIAHPKTQALVRDPEFLKLAQSQDFQKLSAHPKFASTLQDAEIRDLLQKVDFKKYMS